MTVTKSRPHLKRNLVIAAVLFAAFVLSQSAILLDGLGFESLITRYAQQLAIARSG